LEFLKEYPQKGVKELLKGSRVATHVGVPEGIPTKEAMSSLRELLENTHKRSHELLARGCKADHVEVLVASLGAPDNYS
jgi:hypothetical protein